MAALKQTFQVDLVIYGIPYAQEVEANNASEAIIRAGDVVLPRHTAQAGAAVIQNARQQVVPKGH